MNEVNRENKAASSHEITIEELRRVHLLIGIPMYGGMCSGITTKSLCDLHTTFAKYGIGLSINFLFNESLVQRARNYLAENFIANPEFTHLMFIDADIGFTPDDIINLITFNLKDPECKDVVAGIYPRKAIAWEKIVKLANTKVVENPEELAIYGGDFVFNFKKDVTEFSIYNPLQVSETGTGFMLIPRHVLENFENAFPEYRYLPDHLRTPGFDGSKEITAFFHCEIDPESKRYLSEDYFFCKKIGELGMTTTILPWINLDHLGSYVYKGDVTKMVTSNLDLVSSGKE